MSTAEKSSRGAKNAAEGPRRTRRQPGELQVAILTAARAAFEENGYRHTTTREIAKLGAFSEVLIFRHFGSKAQLFRECIIDPFRNELALISESYDENNPSKEFFVRLFTLLRRNRRVIVSLMSASNYDSEVDLSAPDRSSMITPLVESLEVVTQRDARRHGLENIDAGMTTAVSMATLFGMVVFDEWILGSHMDDRKFDEVVDATWNHLTYGWPRGRRSSSRRTRSG